MTERFDFTQHEWSPELEDDCRRLVRLAIREDLDRGCDLTTMALVPPGTPGEAHIVARQAGVIAGLPVVATILEEMEIRAAWTPLVGDGDRVTSGTRLGHLACPARELLTAERIILNFIGRLSGVATLTRRFVEAVAPSRARIYDTRKTTPGWRRLEKYAVRRGGGHNHRTGLFDAILIKDNHLAVAARLGGTIWTPAQAVLRARDFLQQSQRDPEQVARTLIEIEVDTLEQLQQVLPTAPQLVLLDNMTPAQLAQAVALRDASGVSTELEASGGITLDSVHVVAATGVDRISSGAITHSAIALDVALDWV